MRRLAHLCLLPALCLGAPAAWAEAAPTAEAARALLDRPTGSLSLGGTGFGELVGAAQLPLKGEGWRFLSRVKKRKTHHGTDEMAALVRRLGAHVHTRMEGGRLSLGNISVARGGRTPWHASHQSGRDIDLLFFARDGDGAAVSMTSFVAFDEALETPQGKFRFDVPRNLSLIRALVEDPKARVQWVFVAAWLKAPMMALAAEQGLPAETLAQLDAVLHQPSDSNPHADHFHVRIYCSAQDRRHGCLDYGPKRAWVDLGDDAFAAHVRGLEAITRHPKRALRLEALQALGAVRAVHALPTLLAAAEDRDAGIRKKAISVIRRIGAPEAIDGVMVALARTPDGARAQALFSILEAIPSADVVPPAMALLETPAATLHPDLPPKARRPLQRVAAGLLATYGRECAVEPLLGLLASKSTSVRAAAHEALKAVTNQRIRGRVDGASYRRTLKRWTAFWDAHGEEGWLAWMARGFEARKVRLPEGLHHPSAIGALIDVIGHRDEVLSDNAVRTLSALTGHHVAPRSRTTRRMKRHWRNWWAAHQGEVSLAPVGPPPPTESP